MSRNKRERYQVFAKASRHERNIREHYIPKAECPIGQTIIGMLRNSRDLPSIEGVGVSVSNPDYMGVVYVNGHPKLLTIEAKSGVSKKVKSKMGRQLPGFSFYTSLALNQMREYEPEELIERFGIEPEVLFALEHNPYDCRYNRVIMPNSKPCSHFAYEQNGILVFENSVWSLDILHHDRSITTYGEDGRIVLGRHDTIDSLFDEPIFDV